MSASTRVPATPTATLPANAPAIPQHPNRPMQERVAQVLQQAITRQRVVGAVALVNQDGHARVRIAAGLADREAQRPMALDSVFRWASLSKPVVTVAALRLIEQGRLALDTPVTAWLPEFTPRLRGQPAPITIQQLLTHTAGLGYGFEDAADSHYAQLGVSDGLDDSGLSLDENLQRLAQAPLYFEPGTQWRYSLSIDVLGAVIERVSGQPLPDAVIALVTGPLQMLDAGFSCGSGQAARLAVPYADATPMPVRMTAHMQVPLPEWLGRAVLFDPQRAFDATAFPSAGAGMLGTADDLMRLLESIRIDDGTLLKAGALQQMMQAHVGAQAQTQGPGWGFGYGGAVLVDPVAACTPQAAGTLQWGGVYGHNWFIDPQRGLSVVLMTNTAFEGMLGTIVSEVRNAVYGVDGA